MKILFFDPGAERMGWASIESGPHPIYHMSDTIVVPREGMGFQEYRLELTATLIKYLPVLFDLTDPDVIGTETVPAVGGGNYSLAAQSYLANVAATTVHVLAIARSIELVQVGATTIKKAIGGKGNATKVRVRNGVIEVFPELSRMKSLWKPPGQGGIGFDEPDSIAGALTYLGIKV